MMVCGVFSRSSGSFFFIIIHFILFTSCYYFIYLFILFLFIDSIYLYVYSFIYLFIIVIIFFPSFFFMESLTMNLSTPGPADSLTQTMTQGMTKDSFELFPL